MNLSPSAPPFEPIEFAIFNDGVPGSVFFGVHPEHEIVQHIPDEAIEEIFPPSAEDVAELEAAEDWVETLAWLAYLDECDEAARFSMAGFGKRWAARRKAGLIGKPHPARSVVRRHDTDSDSGDGSMVAAGQRLRSGTITSWESSSALVPYVPRIFEVRPRKVENRMFGAHECAPKNARMYGGRRAMIQQPRKHY